MFFWVRDKHLNHLTDIIIRKGGALLSIKLPGRCIVCALKRISACSFCGRLYKAHTAGMTVEACLVLPLFLFAFLNVISIIEIYRLQGAMSAAMHDTAKQMAVYGYAYREIGGGSMGAVESVSLTYLYAAERVRSKLGTDYLENAPLSQGAFAISWLRSRVMQEDDCIDLVAEYTVRPPVAIIGYQPQTLYNRMRTRAWTGYDNAANASSGSAQERIVYITPDGSVYHGSRACTYLNLSIVSVDQGIVDTQRNEDGGRYYPCETCGNSCGSVVYITDYGDRYHASLGCSGLKRTILAVPISQTGGRGACSKCG